MGRWRVHTTAGSRVRMRRDHDRVEAREIGLPAALIDVVRRGDVPAVCIALDAHVRNGGKLPTYLEGMRKLAARSSEYSDQQALAAWARDVLSELAHDAA